MAHQPDWSSPAGGLVASALGADEHDHLSSSVVITHQGQRPTAPLTHSVSLRVHYVHAHNRLFFALSFTSHIYHLNVWQISKLKFKMWDHICCGFTTKPTCPCSTHLITLLCWQQPVMGYYVFGYSGQQIFMKKRGIEGILNLTHIITGLHGWAGCIWVVKIQSSGLWGLRRYAAVIIKFDKNVRLDKSMMILISEKSKVNFVVRLVTMKTVESVWRIHRLISLQLHSNFKPAMVKTFFSMKINCTSWSFT